MLIAEIVQLDSPLRKAILAKTDSNEIENILMSKVIRICSKTACDLSKTVLRHKMK